MTYEKYKTGIFRVGVFLTILLWAITIVSDRGHKLFGNYFNMEEILLLTPIFVWSIYFFSLWIAKGFIGKE